MGLLSKRAIKSGQLVIQEIYLLVLMYMLRKVTLVVERRKELKFIILLMYIEAILNPQLLLQVKVHLLLQIQFQLLLQDQITTLQILKVIYLAIQQRIISEARVTKTSEGKRLVTWLMIFYRRIIWIKYLFIFVL
jgi:hypothetical protein